MSGDTPTRVDGIPHSLDCPDCSSAVFARAVAHWTHGESEYCPGCGSSLRVSLEEHDGDPDELTAVAVSYEHGGEVVARLLADIEYLQTRPAQGVSEGLRACVEAAGQACLDGEADCIRPGCVVGHQAGTILDAYDDAAADVERLTAKLDGHAALAEVQIARLTEERDDRMREVCVWHGRDIVGQRFPGPILGMQGARKAAAARGWGHLYPEDSTTHEPGNAEYIAWSDAGMPPPAPGHGEPAYTCSGCGKPAQPKHSACCDLPIERHGEPGGEK